MCVSACLSLPLNIHLLKCHINQIRLLLMNIVFLVLLIRCKKPRFSMYVSRLMHHCSTISFCLKYCFPSYSFLLDEERVAKFTTPSQGFWRWGNIPGKNLWGNSRNAPFDKEVNENCKTYWKALATS